MNTAKQPMYEWNALPWKSIERQVFKLQKRIHQASLRGDVKTVHKLQRLLMNSWSAKCLAVRRVTQDNKGKRTAGVDGVASLTPAQRLALVRTMNADQKARPLRRVWIPKPGSSEKRPLGIPAMADRALQALVKLALEPEWEAKFEPNSYGFRPGRSAHDAIEAIFLSIRYKPKFVLDADIAKCFDRINHEALLDRLGTYPQLRRLIKAWLKAGVMEGETLFPTEEGTPQGGVISPLLANIALHGFETAITTAFPKEVEGKRGPEGKRNRIGWQPRVIRYADDFVILHRDLGVILEAKRMATEWLKGMGLELKDRKSVV
jgi:RNA-directed DNA polymerase